MATIVPISEMRDTSKMQDLCEKEPVFVTKNGYGCMVILNMDSYNEIQEVLLEIELQKEYKKSQTEGNSVDARELIRTLRKSK